MPKARPQRVIVEFDDGTRSEASFEALPSQLQFELLREPFVSRPSPDPEAEKFVLLEWKDGWKEVVEVGADCSEINRYYVISRPEDVGRLSLKRGDGYPELIEIARKPLDLKRITFLGTFRLSLERSSREGKKVDHFFKLSEGKDAIQEELEAFKRALREERMDLDQMRAQDPDRQQEDYERIRRKMGLKAAQRQQDVLDFIALLARLAG